MLRPIAHLLIVTLMLSSGRLLACGWECGDAVTASVEGACHNESPDSGAALIGGVAHECPPAAIDSVVTAANKVEPHVIGALFSPGYSIASHRPAIGLPGGPTLDRRAFAPAAIINVLRI